MTATAATAFRPCVLIPTLDNPATLRDLVLAVRVHLPDVIVVDDGSGPAGAAACRALADESLIHLDVRATNGGKGAAVKRGFEVAAARGFSHALQIDADRQHDTDDVPRLLAAAAATPEALVLGRPIFDASAPRLRRWARMLTVGLVHAQAGGPAIADPMCGFRVYPLAAARAAGARGDAMDFDPEIAVRLRWAGAPIVNLPTRVRYPAGGVSSFRQVRDNALLTWMHVRLCCQAPLRLAALAARRRRPADAPRTWLSTREKGSVLGLRLIVFLATAFGRRAAHAVLRLVALYFVLFHPSVRRASRGYLARIGGRPVGFGAIYRHVRCFAHVAVDRLFFLKRRFELFRVTETGKHYLIDLRERRTGALLLGAHLGSFEAMRALSARANLPLNIVGYFRNARVINSMIERIDPTSRVRLIEVDPESVAFVFRIKACIERGELVAILGDRVGLGSGTATVRFLGAPAEVSSGPYALAAALRCPVYFTCGLYTAPDRYDLHCEPFAERIVLPREDRRATLARYAQEFADRLERHCRVAPDNWFNFYDFWAAQGAAEAEAGAPAATPVRMEREAAR